MTAKIQIIRDLTEEQLLEFADIYESATDVVKNHFNWGKYSRAITLLSTRLSDLSIEFRIPYKNKRTFPLITKKCPNCGLEFQTGKGTAKEQRFCSRGCSTSFTRRGKDHPNYKGGSKGYRGECFKHHKKECVVCGETIAIDVHHFDGDHTNNNPENLIPLCRNHHYYWHSKEYNYLVCDIINCYVENYVISSMVERLIPNQ